MPTKRNRKDSESSNCSLTGILESTTTSTESEHANEKDDVSNADECAWLRPCCTPMGCIFDGGQVNLTKPDEIGKVVCSNENCSSGPYMHKECFSRWEDGLLTYLRSHGRARSWSEKQRRQNLWTKRGYDLAYRACTCKCTRGHLRKDLNWNPKETILTGDSLKEANEEATRKKNRKKHKDLPTLGNKYSVAVARSKSKAIPAASGRDGRVRTSSASSSMSVDQGYSSSSPSNSDAHGPYSAGFFSPPQHHNGRVHIQSNHRVTGRGVGLHGSTNLLFSHVGLPQIPDNDILEDFCEQGGDLSHLNSPGHSVHPQQFGNMGFFGNQPLMNPLNSPGFDAPAPSTPDFNISDMGKLFKNMNVSMPIPPRKRCHSWSDPYESAGSGGLFNLKEESLSWTGKPGKAASKLFHASSLDMVPENSAGLPFSIGHWNGTSPSKPLWDNQQCNHNKSCGCDNTNEEFNQAYLTGFQDFPNSQTTICSDIDLKAPKVIVIPGNGADKRTSTEITITPMSNTTFHKRYDFSSFQCVLQTNQINPYRIKMEGEGYGSDDFRNTILAKLSKEKCSQIECVACGKTLLIYDHFPLLDGALFLSPLQNRIGTAELKIDIENKSGYLHAVCVGCIDGANNMSCVMCDKQWKGSFHQLGTMYMFDIFAATPCCQDRLCCKQCGYAIVDIAHGMKFFSQYSGKISCTSCGSVDYHFVHPASTFTVLGPRKYSFVQ